MENRETLRQYLTYNKDSEELNGIFLNLDRQLKYLHSHGYFVAELNSDAILLETNKYFSDNNQSTFSFASIAKMTNKEKEIRDNIVDLSKLAIGAYISSANGFCDYSGLSINYIKNYFSEMEMYIPDSEYYRRVIIEEDTSYYSDYFAISHSTSKNNSNQKIKATSQGKLYSYDEDAAFVRIVFYPVMIIAIITIAAIIYTFFN